MKLGSLKSGRDGSLVVVDRMLERAVRVPEIAPTLQAVLDDWERIAPELETISSALNRSEAENSFALELNALAAPLPRAYQWLDGSAYLSHVELARRARGAEMPPELYSDPLMYQGGSDGFLAARDPILVANEEWGADFEAEVAIITGDVPMGAGRDEAQRHIRLFMLVNDVSLRALIPAELAKGFGFLHGKPASACSPVAVTADELGDSWDGARVHLPLESRVNGEICGRPNAGVDMHFDFPALISHAAKTRDLSAGTIIGSGTVSNYDRSAGVSCFVEKRMIETLEKGKAVTPFLRFGDRVRIEMLDQNKRSIFGAIEQVVTPRPR
ncbi:MAG TPA: fumarylacetoacetate hydrolase family protein [Burkholderiales bacterium]|nr:fumarylacetoacetate hydrolase family protein [Burkholderiales bacterium]